MLLNIKIVLILILAVGFASAQSFTARELTQQAEDLFSSSRWSEASVVYLKLLDSYGDHPEFAPLREAVEERAILCCSKVENWKQLDLLISSHLKRYPQSTKIERLQLELARARLKLNQLDSAIHLLTEWQKSYPKSEAFVDSLWLHGAILTKNDQHRAALAVFLDPRLRKESDSSLRADIAVFEIYLKLHQWNEAIHQIEEKQGTSDAWGKAIRPSLWMLAVGLENDQDFDRASMIRQKIVRESEPEKRPQETMRWANSLLLAGRYREALLVLEEIDLAAVSEKKTIQWIYQTRWTCCNKMERWSEASDFAFKCRQLTSESDVKLNWLLRELDGLQKQNRLEAIVATLEAWLLSHPETAYGDRLRYMVAVSCVKLGRGKEALDYSEAVQKKHPKSAFVIPSKWLQSQALMVMNQFRPSSVLLLELTREKSMESMISTVWHRMGICRWRLGEIVEAQRAAEKALTLSKSSTEEVEARELLSDLLGSQSKWSEALAMLEGASNMDVAGRTRLILKRASILTRQKKWDLVEALLIQGWNHSGEREHEFARLWIELSRVQGAKVSLDRVERFLISKGDLLPPLQVERLLASWVKEGERRGKKVEVILNQWRETAESRNEKRWKSRLCHAQAELNRKSNIVRAREYDLQAIHEVDLKESTPSELIAGCEAAAALKKFALFQTCFNELIDHYPQTVVADQARVLRIDQGLEDKESRRHWEIILSGERVSGALARAYRWRAENAMQARSYLKALEDWEKYLKSPSVKGRLAAEALMAMGECRLAVGELERALATYQRVYVVYFSQADLAARAYWESGQIFERLNRLEEARKTFEELVNQEAFAACDATVHARRRLHAWGGGSL